MNVHFDPRAWLIAVVALAFAGCTATPVKKDAPPASAGKSQAANQPEAGDDDLLAQMLAGEFAIGQSDIAAAAVRYGNAARLSKDPQVSAQAARLALAARNYSLAREMLARWRTLKPEDPGLLQVEAGLAMGGGDAEAAFAALQKLLPLPNEQGWRYLGQTLLGAADKPMAAALLERLATPANLAAASEDIWIAMSQLAFKLDRKAYSRTLADAAVQKFSGGPSFGWSAQLAADEGDKRRAIALYKEAIQRSPKDIRMRAGYALLLSEEGDHRGAAKVLADGPQDEYTYAARAAYVARSEDEKLVQALFDEMKALPEEQSAAHADLLGQLAELLEQPAIALTWYQKVSEDDDNWFDAQVRIAVIEDQQGKHDAALTLTHDLQARVGDDPKRLADAFLLEGELLIHAGKDDAVQEAYSRGIKLLPTDTRLIYARALHAANIGRVDDAERDLRRVLELKPSDVDAMNALGYTLADANRKLDEALSLIERALKAKPEEPAVIDSLGWVRYRRGELAEAETALKRAFDKQPDAEIAAHYGEVLWHNGKREEARKVLGEARKKDDKNKSLLETMKRLGL
ncbi:tetratricopeptide repeat protein [Tahibacter amnicola]|uniref:Tetratricopeptide repeat protein n=1 Tax=Tahibacter amnicola TaxID=2976241 RepID=A0ABY6BD10_9GAMM|nr:tetratricopeptide repeat protein [Tahibacter amnicola]UXI67417.1 tetratricopeptide repeat protein [Tahibacter amnicola]